MFFKKKFGEENEELEEILEKGRHKIWLKKNSKEIPLERKSLINFLKETKIKPKFLIEILKKIEKANFLFEEKVSLPEKIIISSEKREEEQTGAEINLEKGKWKFLINLEDCRFDKSEESKLSVIEAIYFLALYLQLVFGDVPDIQRILEKNQVFEKIERHFREELRKIKKEEKTVEFLEELKRVVLQNSLEIASFIEMKVSLKKSSAITNLLMKATKFTRDSLQKSHSFLETSFLLADLALSFEEAKITEKRKIQKRIQTTINRSLSKELKEIFKDFRRIYSQVKENKYEKKIKEIQEEILVPEILEKYKESILKEIAQRLNQIQLMKEIGKISKEKEKKILRELLEKGATKEDFEEITKIIEKGNESPYFLFSKFCKI
jgi:hypothetical protein